MVSMKWDVFRVMGVALVLSRTKMKLSKDNHVVNFCLRLSVKITVLTLRSNMTLLH